MKEFIIEATTKANTVLEKQVPITKKKEVQVDISNIAPVKLIDFMKQNNIPEYAFFGTSYNSDEYSYSSSDTPVLCYDIDITTTEVDRLKYKRKRFQNIVFPLLYKSLTENGYKRIGFSSGKLKEFDDTTVYDMYINSDFDRLVKYYSLYFIKIESGVTNEGN